jgi:hypothetical protein
VLINKLIKAYIEEYKD